MPIILENVASSGINIQLCQMISNKDLISKKISNQECLKNMSCLLRIISFTMPKTFYQI